MTSEKVLTIYPNCSMGGMTTVYVNRVLADSGVQHHFVFQNDFGAAGLYEGLGNARVDIVDKSRMAAFTQHAVLHQNYDEIRITSLPDIANSISRDIGAALIYEFHSSDEAVINRELEILDTERLDEVRVPSTYLAGVVRSYLKDSDVKVVVVPNLVNHEVFSCVSESDGPWALLDGSRPLVWVGRFDKGKNPRDFVRVLSLLPSEFVGVVVVSMEKAPDRLAGFLADVASYSLSDRISVMMNLSPEEIASLYRYAKSAGGFFVSTSLGESFGYGVAESMATGLPVVAYDVGALKERTGGGSTLELIPVGDISHMAERIAAE